MKPEPDQTLPGNGPTANDSPGHSGETDPGHSGEAGLDHSGEAGPGDSGKPDLDRRLFIALRTRCHQRPLELALVALSQSGNWGFLWIGLALIGWIIGLVTGAGGGRGMAIIMPAAVWTTLAANNAVKLFVGRQRPVSSEPGLEPLLGVPASTSFPSSHAAMSFAGATILAYFHPSLWPLYFSLAFVVSWTRVYAGVHYPSDVLAGTVVGLVMGGFWMLFLNWI